MLLQAEPGQASFSSFFFFFEHISQILEKRPEKSIKSMNGFPSKTHAFKGETEGYRGMGAVLGVDSRSCWNEIMRNRISEEIRSDGKIVPCIWAASKRWRRKSDGGRLRRRCVSVCVCVGGGGCYWSLSFWMCVWLCSWVRLSTHNLRPPNLRSPLRALWSCLCAW